LAYNPEILQRSAAVARGLAIDAISECSSGHLGLPLGAADLGASLFGECLSFNPQEPRWINRDRFILSAGHGSMFLYAWLHLAGYKVSLNDIKSFRKLGSITPGHPEFKETPGVEATTGPLGQGVANAVGMAVSARMAAARYNKPDHDILDYRVIVLAGDGCMQEGVTLEATELAGHLALSNLILIWDANDVTLDAMAIATQSRDTKARYEACGWEVHDIDGHDIQSVIDTYKKARIAESAKPQLIISNTEICRGIPELAGTPKGHGEGGIKFAKTARAGLGLPEDRFYVDPDVTDYFADRANAHKKNYAEWSKLYHAWEEKFPELAAEIACGNSNSETDLLNQVPHFDNKVDIATRKAGSVTLQAIAATDPTLISLNADLYGSNLNYISGGGDFSTDNPAGRNFRVGIREHAMSAMLNGFAYDGFFNVHGATFLVFSDYMRPSMRIAGLASLPVSYYFTHDSIGVGEDGPTHQPVESISAIRLIPGMELFRPADPEETAASLCAAVACQSGPVSVAMTRQTVKTQGQVSAAIRRSGTLRGAYVIQKESADLKAIVIASGSEVGIAIEAADRLLSEGIAGVRVVSMPSMERFASQETVYQHEVLPQDCWRRVAVEAGVKDCWYRWVGTRGEIISIDRFGLSAPAPLIFDELGINADNIYQKIKKLLGQS
jgi:transketolase